MSFENLNPRERSTLKALISHYISTAEPVGSRTISHHYLKGLSPATIRNVMQDLEELGLLEQPHTSAGRVPTDKGYRLYVDSLVEPRKLSEQQKENIRNQLNLDYAAVEEILSQTSKVLGQVSQELGISISPSFEQGVLTRIELIPVAEKRIMVVLAVKSGLVRTILLEVQSTLQEDLLEETRKILNEKLCGLTLGEIRSSISQRLRDASSGDARLIRLFLESTNQILDSLQSEQIHIGGTGNVLKQPEMQNPQKLQSFLQLIEEKKLLTELLSSHHIKEGITITIGTESEKGEMSSFSLVTSTYQAGKVKGTIGVVGPTRMPYSKLISIVDYTAKALSEILSE
ncbi:MAG: heat-inducible transcription repressor HrcA [candidate division Zixibacteria bacterium RBG_16_50_21]|nr:MAG: heat-inducible transcription repressor HrcA [candidate division Zixibacteria bacterium RBG_16_50_21]